MGATGLNTGFAFRSDSFNTTVEKDYVINPCCYGDDAARWLIAELRTKGYASGAEPGQEDFGWYFGFEAGGVRHDVVIGFRPDGDDGQGEWLCWMERHAVLIELHTGTAEGCQARGHRRNPASPGRFAHDLQLSFRSGEGTLSLVAHPVCPLQEAE
ncbi:MAG: hypothetical protein HYX27_21280 [Acidobacteria bacterium]|nr:hypothetical protein [Acidobacteriota bacterium]